jgi:isopentenyl-diphosphate Delta-isomerase
MNQTEERKRDHIQIAVRETIAMHHNYWDDVHLHHNALPEINEQEINLETILLGKRLGAPIVLSGMTGGYPEGKKINEHLAAAAAEHQLALGVGSQRAALENGKLSDTYSIITDYNIPLKIANIGASQMVLWDKSQLLSNAGKIVEMIDADVIAVCLNFLQEAIQPEGEAHAKGCLDMIDMLSREFSRPVIVKESGAGISGKVASSLKKTNIAAIDVGGAGGTSFAAVEHFRAKAKGDTIRSREGDTFWDWGIPTPTCILEVGKATSWELPIIATGGIRNGLDAAKALILGASTAGVAHAVLKAAVKDAKTTILECETILRELRTTMFLVGADSIEKLSTTEVTYGLDY